MSRLFSHFRSLFIALLACACVLLAACASIGRPEGGPRDYQPPVMVSVNPPIGSLNVRPSRIEIVFNENVQLDDAFNKVIMSPASKNTPVVRALGRRVTVEVRDTLADTTTYTIDFADAIKDLNEGNILDGFAIDFSTGPTIDTLQISGMVFEARNLEPAQNMTVAVTTNFSDTAFAKVPFQRIARTNQLGQFTVRNLKPGKYRVYAVNDVNRDRLWDRSEDIAFYDVAVEPSAHAVMVADTLRAADQSDSIVSRQATHFMPDNLLLTWFNENFLAQYIKDHQRPDRRRIVLNFAAPADSLPGVVIVGGKDNGRDISDLALVATSARNDSITYWLKDPDLIATDSISLAITHMATDSLQQLSPKTDTVLFAFRPPKETKKKDKADNDSVPRVEPLSLSALTSSSQELRKPVILSLPEPIGSIDTAAVHFSQLVDTVWTPLTLPPLVPYPVAPLTARSISYEWAPGAKYRIEVDSAAVSSVYGTPVRKLSHEFTAKKLEDYANLFIKVSAPHDSAAMVVELLDGSDQVKRVATVGADGKAVFELVAPATYYARVFFDRNNNGVWDTGNVAAKIQPEDVAYYPKKIILRANWDSDLDWDVYATPIDVQKPREIKKNKPKLKKGEEEPDAEDEELDEWGEPINKGNKRGSKNNFSIPGLNGGLQQSSGSTGNIRR